MGNRHPKETQPEDASKLGQADAKPTLADVKEAAQPNASELETNENNKDSQGEVGEVVGAVQTNADENYNKYLRAVAELENYKKRAAREKIDALKFGNERLLADLLPIYDALIRAIEQVASETVDRAGFKEGLEMLRDKLSGVLAKHGLEAIESLHKDFDPNFHEALLMRESDELPHNIVVAELEKGFILNGRLLRPARVEVCQNKNNK